MVYRHIVRSVLVVLLVVVSASAVVLTAQDEESSVVTPEMRTLISNMRAATVPFHNLETAIDAGYGKFLDCFRYGEDLGMGQHYVNGELAGDDILDPLQPEALVYEPHADGTMSLVAFEYLVFASVWDADDSGREPPTLFGQEFSLKTMIPDTPPVWALHIWLWSPNPEGLFADYNPLILCPEGEPFIDMEM